MRNHMNFRALGAGILFAAVSAFAQTPGTTSTSALSSPQLPPVGLAASETAQVNVVNGAWPTSGGVAPRCAGTIVFYGGSGWTVLGTVSAFEVESGQIFSVALPYASTGASGSRTIIRVAIVLSPFLIPTAAGLETTPCTLVASLETYDSVTGVTHTFVSGVAMQDPTGISRQTKSEVVP